MPYVATESTKQLLPLLVQRLTISVAMTIDDALAQARARRRLPEPAQRRARRMLAGVSQQAVADAVGTTVATVSRWESGQRMPRGEHLRSYAAVLDRLANEARCDDDASA